MTIQQYLDNKFLDYKLSGKNIGGNWIGLKECPYCHDNRFHSALNQKRGNFSCWSCEENKSFINFIIEIENTTFHKAKEISKKYLDNNYFEDENEFTPYQGNILPPESSNNFPQIHLNYLKSRNFNPQKLIKKYKLQATHNLGRYKFKIIAPVFLNRKIVNFVACDVTGKCETKYLFPPNKKVIVPIHNCLYNIDNINSYAILTEGITDVWNIGEGCICSFGKNLSQNQITLLLEKEVVRVVVIPDCDAQDNGERIANQLSGIIDSVDLIYLEKGDPGELTKLEINKLKRELEI